MAFVFWLVAGAVLIGIEMMTGAYIAVSLAAGCFGVAIADVLAGDFLIVRDVPVFGVLTVGAFVALRRAFGRKGDSRVVEGDVNKY